MSYELQLAATALALVAPGKGILAADESTGTMARRFQSVGMENSESNRRNYRELLFTAAGLGDSISGVILYDETLRQQGADGTPLVRQLQRQGIIPGIKVDQGAKALARFAGEQVTEGLDGLRERLLEYRELGARFTKWRAVIRIDGELPTDACLRVNAHALARFAALSQEAGLVPIVEPEVLMDGDHDLSRHGQVTQRALRTVFDALLDQRVCLESMLLKPNMVLPGEDCPQPAGVAEVAEATLRCLKRTVPAAVPGLVFLSGGQGDVRATEHLNALNQLDGAPWPLSFSFGRALQAPTLQEWSGMAGKVAAAQQKLIHRARCNGAACSGKYSEAMEM